MDDDFALALRLSVDLAKKNEENNKNREKLQNPTSIVDPAWELLDPLPDIHELFVQFNMAYFDGMLGSVEVKWSASDRMTL